MTSFFDLLARNAPSIQTRQALVLIGLQQDFLQPDGLLASKADAGFNQRIEQLVDGFRPYGNVIWIRSEYDPALQHSRDVDEWTSITRPELDLGDAELFLDPGRPEPQVCLKGSPGAAFTVHAKALIQPQDLQLVKNEYSAFTRSNLLLELRCRLITKLYICGALSNISVYTTAIDAARSGFEVALIEDCLAYRIQERHEQAMRQLGRASAARILTKGQVLHFLQHPEDDVTDDADDEYAESEGYIEEDEEITARLAAIEVDSEASEDEMMLPVFPPFNLTPQRQDFSELVARHAKLNLARDDSTELPPPSKDVYNHNINNNQVSSTKRPRNDSYESISDGVRDKKHISTSSMDVPHHCLVKTWVADGAQLETAMSRDEAQTSQSIPLFGEDKAEDSEGSTITYDLLDAHAASTAFQDISNEVEWQRMLHQTGEVPRLVCCQGTIAADGSMPVYRHPSDKTILAVPWTAVVDRIRLEAQKVVGHELNHGLIQLYRSGNDFISEHSDKTLDIVPGSTIVNVSLGAERTMRLRSKRVADAPTPAPRTTHRIRMPHNSMISMTLKTNAVYLHGINADKRPRVELTEEELAYEGARVSLTFRQIGTFVSGDGALLWGQGIPGKTQDDARPALVADKIESDRLILAFGQENQGSVVDWHRWYGEGSNVLHLK